MVVNVALIVVRFDATSRGHHGVIWGWGLRGRMNYNGPGEQWEKSADVQVEDNTNVTTNEMTVQMNCLRLLVTGFKLINSLHGTRSQPWGLKQIWRVDHYFKTVFILTIICWQWPPENKLHLYISIKGARLHWQGIFGEAYLQAWTLRTLGEVVLTV